jgi:acetylornithine deacetylase/succinyl-diaminopimelate desuccinylase-like protein
MKTILVAAASAWLDFRLVPDQHPDEILDLLRAHLERQDFDDIEVSLLGASEPAGTPLEHPFVQRVVRVAEAVSGKPASVMPRIGGSLPSVASLQRHLGMPGVSAPDNPFYFGARVHAPNEHVKLEDVEHAVRFRYALFRDFGVAA